jgi:hypothetical protein
VIARERSGREKPRSTPRGTGKSRGLARLASLLLLALLQLVTVAPLSAPFLDARLHVDFDNAWFATMARNGLRNGDARSQLGVTLNHYARWGDRLGQPEYYTHHPFLMKMLFQQVTRITGTGEAAPRAFALLISFAIAACLLLLVERTTGRLGAGVAAATTLVSIPVFSGFAATLKFESDGMLAALLGLLAIERALRRPGLRSELVVAVAAAFAALAHWSGALAVAVACALLAWRGMRRRHTGARRIAAAGLAGLAAGEALFASAAIWLQRGVDPAWRALAGGFRTRAAGSAFTAGEWAAREWLYLRENFTVSLLVLAIAIPVAAAVFARRAAASGRTRAAVDVNGPGTWFLTLATAATLATAVIWVVALRQGSFVHSYWQLWLALPIAALVGAGVARTQENPRLAAGGVLGAIALVAFLQVAAAEARERTAQACLGTPDDVVFLVSLREQRFERLVFFALASTPLNEWFSGPLFAYYTDRPVAVGRSSERLRGSDLVIVVRQAEHTRLASELGRRLGVRLADERCGGRLCAYAVRPL